MSDSHATPEQKRRVLDYIGYRREYYGESPTIRQIASALFMGKSTVRQTIEALKNDGALERDYRASRQTQTAVSTKTSKVYDHDKAGAAKVPGRSYERVPLDSLLNEYVTVVRYDGNVPDPEYALVDYRNYHGMERFTEREKDVFILSVACLMAGVEIAQYLGISEETVRWNLMNAHAKCEQAN